MVHFFVYTLLSLPADKVLFLFKILKSAIHEPNILRDFHFIFLGLNQEVYNILLIVFFYLMLVVITVIVLDIMLTLYPFVL